MTTTSFEPGIDAMMRDFGNHQASLKGFSVSVYTIGYCIGMVIVAPASEIYGRLWPLRIAYPVFLVSLVLCSISKNIAMFIIFDGVMGFAGIVWVVLGPAIIPDIVPEERRGLCLSAMMTGVSLVSQKSFATVLTVWTWSYIIETLTMLQGPTLGKLTPICDTHVSTDLDET